MWRKLNLSNKPGHARLLCLLALMLAVLSTAACAANSSEQATFANAKPIPHSTIAEEAGAGIAKAMLSCATDRYAHGVLGDAIEAGCLVVEDDKGRSFVFELPQSQVFEDLTPRIADMDGDGVNDVVVIQSDAQEGAALAIYTIQNGAVVALAATPPIGLAHRWLAPIGIDDFNKDGALDVAYVQTPHIGGILKIWSIGVDGFVQIAESRGFSNHSIGSTRVSTSKLVDHNHDGVMDIALPDQSRQQTVWVTLIPELTVLDKKPYEQGYFD